MIILLAASSVYLSGLQAGITGPTADFRGCLREAATKATSEKVAGDAIEAYLKKACTAQMGTLSEALIAFRMKNGMTHKAAASDAAMTVDDYVSTPVDNYKFLADRDAKAAAAAAKPAATPAAAPAAAAAKPVVTPAAAPAAPANQPPKP